MGVCEKIFILALISIKIICGEWTRSGAWYHSMYLVSGFPDFFLGYIFPRIKNYFGE